MVAYDVYCLIEPKQELIEFVTQSFPEFIEYAKGKHIWKMPYGGYGGPTPSERDIATKLMFLAEFRSIAMFREQPRNGAFLDALMSRPPFGENIFDQWWTFERSIHTADFEEHLNNISLEQFQLISKTGLNRIDAWFERLQEMKENGEI
jgi:hypothetical protein